MRSDEGAQTGFGGLTTTYAPPMKRGIASFLLVVALSAGSSLIEMPTARANCLNGDVVPAAGGTYSLCVTGQWVHVDRQLCIDYPQSPYCGAGAPTTPVTTSATPAPLAPPAVPPPPAAYIPDVPYIPVAPVAPLMPSLNVPNIGCTWVNGYTKKNGTRVRGHWRC